MTIMFAISILNNKKKLNINLKTRSIPYCNWDHVVESANCISLYCFFFHKKEAFFSALYKASRANYKIITILLRSKLNISLKTHFRIQNNFLQLKAIYKLFSFLRYLNFCHDILVM